MVLSAENGNERRTLQEVEADAIHEYTIGNVTRLGFVNLLLRGGFNLAYATELGNKLPRDAMFERGYRLALEDAANLCEAEARMRFEQARRADEGDQSWGADTEASSRAQDSMAITASSLAVRIRALTSQP